MKWIPHERYDALVARLRTDVVDGSRSRQRDALAMLLGLHGLRVTETSQLTVGDLDVAANRLHVETIKGGKPRTLRLGAGVADAIVAWRGEATAAPLLFTGRGCAVHPSQFERACRRLTTQIFGAPGQKYHALRHTYAMRLYCRTRDLLNVKSRLGHRSVNATMVYLEAYDQAFGDCEPDELESLKRHDARPKIVSLFPESDTISPDDPSVGVFQRQFSLRVWQPETAAS